MPKTIFQHIESITSIQQPDYLDNLSEEDLKTFDIYLIQKFLSLNNDLLYGMAIFEKYAHKMSKKEYYKLLIYNIPKKKYFLNFNKKDKKDEIPKWFLEILIDYFIFISTDQAVDYFNLLTINQKKILAKKYGIDEELIKNLK